VDFKNSADLRLQVDASTDCTVWYVPYDDVVFKHIDFYDSIHAQYIVVCPRTQHAAQMELDLCMLHCIAGNAIVPFYHNNGMLLDSMGV